MSLAVGCGNNGGVGDGAVDNGDSLVPGGANGIGGHQSGSAGSQSTLAGAAGSGAGANGTAGHGGVAGGGGASGNAGHGGASGSAGHGGASGSGGAGGKGGNGGTAGVSGSASGGMSTTGGGGSGGSSCASATCGNGIVEGCEACDDGPAYINSSGGTGGQSGAGGGSGASTAGSSGTEGSGGAGATINPSYGTLCSSDCNYKISTPECVACEEAGDCLPSLQNCTFPLDAQTNPVAFTPEQSNLCFALMHCVQASNCMDGASKAGSCYCGTLGTMACGAAPFDLTQPGAPNGACAALIQAGMTGLTSNSAILGALVSAKSKPAGAAMNRLNCQKTSDQMGAPHACQTVCGFNSASLPPF